MEGELNLEFDIAIIVRRARRRKGDEMISELFTRPSNVTCTEGFYSDCHRNSFSSSSITVRNCCYVVC